VAVAVVNRLVPILVPPKALPKLELADGIPRELRTLVAVPTLLTSRADIDEQLERLEVHHLANPEGHLHFALLSDWRDASEESMPGDDELLTALADGIERLNERYGSPPGGGDRFLFLQRRRLWNAEEGKWMGWERKRGKLHELNLLLRGSTDTTYIPVKGKPPTVPEGIRFVITLDADTRLPKGTAYRLVGAMAHPLNRPRYDSSKGRVVSGYGILQPRITPSLPTGPGSTPFQRIISGPGGVDPYAAAVSDVYQDLFEEGSYTGKGIYDVDAFETALADKVPENALLSHDLFEGLFARAGLVTDIDLFEEFPSNYEVAARRSHRWVRGDWQLLPWILGYARNDGGQYPPKSLGPHRLSRRRGRLGASWRRPAPLDRAVRGIDSGTYADPCHGRTHPSSVGDLEAKSLARRAQRRRGGLYTVPAGPHRAGPSSPADDTRHHANALATLRQQEQPPRVGHSGASGLRHRSAHTLVLSAPSLGRVSRGGGGRLGPGLQA
jgi:hypothetical protein